VVNRSDAAQQSLSASSVPEEGTDKLGQVYLSLVPEHQLIYWDSHTQTAIGGNDLHTFCAVYRCHEVLYMYMKGCTMGGRRSALRRRQHSDVL